MKQSLILLLIFPAIIFSCSTGKNALERGDYYSAITKAVERLQTDPDNRNAVHVLKDGYPLAVKYFQEEIDITLSGTDRFKWGKTVSIMEQVNSLSEQIRKVPAARTLIENPKTYISEMRPAKEKAAAEQYQAGLELMKSGTKENARQAYLCFTGADRLIPGYKEVNQLIRESKRIATYTVIFEQMQIYPGTYILSPSFFYDRTMAMLRHYFPDNGFVNFYSENDAVNMRIEHPDMILKIGFYDFAIGEDRHAENERPLNKSVEERVKVTQDNAVSYETRTREYSGTIKIISDQISTQGILQVDVLDFQANNHLLISEQIPGQFTWDNSYAVFVGDKEVLDSNDLALLNNRALPLPSPQDLFIGFSRSVFDPLTSRLNSFFGKYAR